MSFKTINQSKFIVAIIMVSVSVALQSVCLGIFLMYSQFSAIIIISLMILCFPVGAMIAQKFFNDTLDSYYSVLTVSFIIIVLNFPAVFLVKNFSLIIDEYFVLSEVLLSIFYIALLFTPTFICWGIIEFQGYRVGLKNITNGAKLVYGIFLISLAFSYLFVNFTIERLGLMHLWALAFFICLMVFLFQFRRKFLTCLAAILLVLFFIIPGSEKKFIELVNIPKIIPPLESNFDDNLLIHQQWSKGVLVSLYKSKDGRSIFGLYNNTLYWGVSKTPDLQKRFVYNLLPDMGKICIIGAGGGADILAAITCHAAEIHAIEVNPLVVDLLTGKCAKDVWNIWKYPTVKPFGMEGRQYIENTGEKFDIISVPSTDNVYFSIKTMFDISERVLTLEGLRVLKNHLGDRGIIHIKKHKILNFEKTLMPRYFLTLKKLGLKPVVLFFENEFNVLGFKQHDDPRINILKRNVQLLKDKTAYIADHIDTSDVSVVYEDNPYNAVPFSSVCSLQTISTFFYKVFFFILIVPVCLAGLVYRSISKNVRPTKTLFIVLLGFFAGANFVLLESELIYRFLRTLSTPMDSLYIGVFVFAALSGVGALMIKKKSFYFVIITTTIFIGFYSYCEGLNWGTSVFPLLPLLFATGRFFPTALAAAPDSVLGIFSMDAAGAFVGSLIALFVPVMFGFNFYFGLTAVLFSVTAVCALILGILNNR